MGQGRAGEGALEALLERRGAEIRARASARVLSEHGAAEALAMFFGAEGSGAARAGEAWSEAALSEATGAAVEVLSAELSGAELGAACLALARRVERLSGEARASQNARLARVLSVVSHDLRSPLVTIRGYIEMVLRGALGGVNAAQEKGLTVAHRNTQALTERLEVLSDLARLWRGELKLELSEVAVGDVLRETLDPFQARARAQGVALEVEVGPVEGRVVWADEERLRRVMGLLLDSALRATERGVVRVEARPLDSGAVRVSVRDTGRGGAAQHTAQRAGRAYRAEVEGGGRLGLGLALVEGVLDAHRSALEVSHKESAGSSFAFTLQAPA